MVNKKQDIIYNIFRLVGHRHRYLRYSDVWQKQVPVEYDYFLDEEYDEDAIYMEYLHVKDHISEHGHTKNIYILFNNMHNRPAELVCRCHRYNF